MVKVYSRGTSSPPEVYHMHHSQVAVFVRATIRLRFEVGNPHTGERLDNIACIYVNSLDLEPVSYWWCAEDLQKNGDPAGAQLNFDHGECVWRRPEEGGGANACASGSRVLT